MSHERLITVITGLEKAVKELTETIKDSNRLAREEMALVTSDAFTESLSKVVDEALDEAIVEHIGGECYRITFGGASIIITVSAALNLSATRE